MTANHERIAQLEAEIAERLDQLRDLKADPMTSDDAAALASADPDEFNRRFDGMVSRGALFAVAKSPKEVVR
jgi:hypothetical protein